MCRSANVALVPVAAEDVIEVTFRWAEKSGSPSVTRHVGRVPEASHPGGSVA
jgi:hypothetical protein